jgi:hypothetical protein
MPSKPAWRQTRPRDDVAGRNYRRVRTHIYNITKLPSSSVPTLTLVFLLMIPEIIEDCTKEEVEQQIP